MARARIVWLLTYLIIGLIFFLPAIDTDLGWHLRYGEYFVETKTLLRENILTYFLADYSWINPYVLYQPLTFLVYRLGGLLGLSLAYSLLFILIFFLFSRNSPKHIFFNLTAFLFVTLLGWNVFSLGWRGQIFTILGVVAVFLVLTRAKRNPWLIFLLPILFWVWANTHGGFVLGLAILGSALFQKIWQRCWRGSILLASSLGISLIAILINPFGIKIYWEALHHAQYPLKNLIAEWVPPVLEIRFLVVIIGLVVLFLLFSSRNKRKLFWFLVIGIFAVLALGARRHLPLFGLSAVLGFGEIMSQKISVFEKWISRRISPIIALVLAVVCLMFSRLPETIEADINFGVYCSGKGVRLPCEAIEFIKQHPFSEKNAYAAYEWGGFLEWELPQYKYFVDGRMPAWPTKEGKSPYTIYLEIIQARPGWEERLEDYGTRWLLIGAGTFLDIELSQNKNSFWKSIYRDELAVIYVKSS